MTLTINRVFKELLRVIFFAVIGIIFSLVLFKVNAVNLFSSAAIWVVLSLGNGYIVEYLNRRISWVERPILRVLVGTFSMLAFTILSVTIVIVGSLWYFNGLDPIMLLQNIGVEDFVVSVLITLIISMFFHGRAFYLNWKQALSREEKLKNETLRSKYESLKNQVNPHFLFNSLNVLSSLVYDDQDKAVTFIRRLSDVYRYVLENKDQELVPLADELNFLQNYIYLQKIRFGENFHLELEKNGDGHVPPLALQLLVENAIKHNVVSEARPLTVRVDISKDSIVISNNLQEKLTKDSTGIGLSNLVDRYKYLSDRPVTIDKNSKTFVITLPLLQIKS